jgi:hypothetical protein
MKVFVLLVLLTLVFANGDNFAYAEGSSNCKESCHQEYSACNKIAVDDAGLEITSKIAACSKNLRTCLEVCKKPQAQSMSNVDNSVQPPIVPQQK